MFICKNKKCVFVRLFTSIRSIIFLVDIYFHFTLLLNNIKTNLNTFKNIKFIKREIIKYFFISDITHASSHLYHLSSYLSYHITFISSSLIYHMFPMHLKKLNNFYSSKILEMQNFTCYMLLQNK